MDLGFDLAVHKEQFGHTDGWIGYDISNTATEISIQIKAEFSLNPKMKRNGFRYCKVGPS